MFGFKSKKDEVLNHWIGFVDGFNLSSQEFYSTFEKELAARKIPTMEMKRVEIAEGGLLSENRLYLQMVRERLAFHICAAPFGNVFFFSCRSVLIPPVVKLWHLVAIVLCLFLLYSNLLKHLGFTYGVIAFIAFFVAIFETFRNTVAHELSNVDAFLIKLSVIGPIYERWFRRDTYYRQDTRLLYLDVVSKLFIKLAEEATAEKGAKLVRQYQSAPVLGELYKPLTQPEAVKKE